MEQNTEKKLLYYDHFEKLIKHYDGAPIFHLVCKDVKTDEEVILGSCCFAEEVSNILGGHYYYDIIDAANDFDILWNLSDEKISPVTDTFEEVKVEYQRMINEGVPPEEINSAMIILFQEKRKIKVR